MNATESPAAGKRAASPLARAVLSRRGLLAAGGVAALAAGALLWARREPALPPLPPPLPDRALGADGAPLTVIEYASLSCGACRAFHLEILPEIKRRFVETGRVRFLFRHAVRNRADVQAAALSQKVAPERFFAFIEMLFQQQESWTAAGEAASALTRLATLAGLTPDEIKAALADAALADAVIGEGVGGQRTFGLSATPTFVIGTQVVSGVSSVEAFAQLLEKALEPAGTRTR